MSEGTFSNIMANIMAHMWIDLVFAGQRSCDSFTINVLKFRTQKLLTKWHMQTMQTQIRLLLKEQSDQGLHCLPFHLVF